VAEAEAAHRRGDFGAALERYLVAAEASEIPPGELCLKIARCYDRLGRLEDAFAWLARIPDACDSFMVWSAAASTLGRLVKQARPPARRRSQVALAGSYTTSQLASMLPLAALGWQVDLTVREGLYDQYQQELIDPSSALYQAEPEQIIIAVHEGALRLPSHSQSPGADVQAEVERWTRLWQAARDHAGAGVIQHNFAVRPEVPLGHLSGGDPGSRYAMVQALNRELATAARDSGASMVDCDRLAAEFGRSSWFDDRYWFRSKQAVALEALPLLARHTAAVVGARLGLTRKCLVLDLDGTLWGGLIGEDGLEGIVLGGGEAGEAFVAFQEYILELKRRGVILAVASKNNEADAREVFERHPEMRVRLDDLAAFAVNWEDKPANLRRIAQSLGIGLDALVLADDNPAERQIVRRLVPEVDVLPMPEQPSDFRRVLAGYLGFESMAVTDEDRQRAAQYRARAAVAELASSASDIQSFYRDLRMKAEVAPFDELHLPRIAQLVGKTNQFNLTTRRHDAAALHGLMQDPACITRYLRLSDRFADHGLVALAIARKDEDVVDIDTLLMSCRVIGRTVEAHLLMHVSRAAQDAGATRLRGTYLPTAKNQLVADLYERFGFALIGEGEDGDTRWEYDLSGRGPIANEFIEDVIFDRDP